MILIDTDILIDISRRHAAALEWLDGLDDEPVLSGFTAMELIQGCRNSKETADADEVIGDFKIIWPDAAALSKAYEIFKSVHASNAIGIIDTCIAMTAVTLQLPLHTFNEKHFSAITSLKIITPYRR